MRTVLPRYALDDFLFRRAGLEAPLHRFRGIHEGQPMLVIGNGPSLNRTPLERFATVPAIGMNKINLLFPRTSWRPRYIITINNLVVQQNREFFETTDIPLFVGFKARWFVDAKRNPNLNLFNIRVSDAFSTEFPRGTGRATTVSYAALQLAYYMGANPVIIFGIDHRFAFDGPARPAVERMQGDDPNHFDPNYFKGMKWGLPDLENDRHLFRLSRAAFEADGRKVYDATLDGLLPVFEKISVDRAAELCGLPAPKAGAGV